MSDESTPSKRRSIGKKLRFEVFTRDNFTCRYCGEQSDKVKLVIDHITPVCKGGGNEMENLITACFGCNSGKGGRPIQKTAQNEMHRLALAQEMHEQMDALARVKAAAATRESIQQVIANFFCNLRGTEAMDMHTLAVLTSYISQHGANRVFGWIEIAVMRTHPEATDQTIGRYVSGIRRRVMEREGINADANAKIVHPNDCPTCYYKVIDGLATFVRCAKCEASRDGLPESEPIGCAS